MSIFSSRHYAMVIAGLALMLPFSALQAQTAARESAIVFDPGKYTVKSVEVGGIPVSYRAYEGLVYVKKPIDTTYQILNFYVPTGYFEGKSINGYKADTAPIFFPNSVGGYMPGGPKGPGVGFDGMVNASAVALSKGLVVAAPGARGRTLRDSAGAYYGKAPAAIVDLKAALRYLRANDALMPGSADRIISNGTSAGGALSSLIGATGNAIDYEPYLRALGAAEARDDIYAVSAYCPITNLENADTAYEWLFSTVHETKAAPARTAPAAAAPLGASPSGMPEGQTAANPFGAPASSAGPLSTRQLEVSALLKGLFPAYLNSLNLKDAGGKILKLNVDGTGSFLDYLKDQVIASATAALKGGKDLSHIAWLTIKAGKASAVDWEAYVAYCGRKKGAPSFDALDNTSGENNLFGTGSVNNQHFTAFSAAFDTARASMADPLLVQMMNPMAYIGNPTATTSKYWRIRHGTLDSDTSLAIPAIMATRLANSGASVDFKLSWDVPHSGDYDLDELFAWVDTICK
jgi:hypothetical protein